MSLPSRKDVPTELTWDLSLIYSDLNAFRQDIQAAEKLASHIVRSYQGNLNTPETIILCLDDYQELTRLLTLVSNYAELASSVDFNDSNAVRLASSTENLSARIAGDLAFMDLEIGANDTVVLETAMERSPANRCYIQNLIRAKEHRLHPETEKALAALSPVLNAPYQFYNMAKLADLRFPSFEVHGKTYPLSYTLFEDNYEYETDTEIRRSAAHAFYSKLMDYENSTASAYNTMVTSEKTLATLRGFDSVFDSLLFSQQVTREMYDRQIDLITQELAPHMRRYARLLQKIHHLDQMTFADLKIAVDPEYVPGISIEDSHRYVREALSIMGEDYVEMIDEAYRDRWFDFASNEGKSTGGFCASPYGKPSFILLSWNGRMSDAFTIAHELGHAGHFKACNQEQSILDTDVSSYLVEAPSTMNELLMSHHMLRTNTDKRFRRWVLSNMISNTYYHNFVTHLLEAWFQREVYKIIDRGGSVDALTLNNLFRLNLETFWANVVAIPEGTERTWMRQPHYYMGLYSYTYSAGLTLATQVCKRIESEGCNAVEDWKQFLRAGNTKSPLQLASLAGIDLSGDEPLRDTIKEIGSIIDEIISLTEELDGITLDD